VCLVSVTAIALGVLTFGIIKFGQFIRVNRGFKKSIAQYVLLIDIIGLNVSIVEILLLYVFTIACLSLVFSSTLRVLATGIDPWEARGGC
jgi:hypothetical protein